MKKFENIKQKGRPLTEYFTEAREMLKALPEVIHPELGKKIVRGLNNYMVRSVIGGRIGIKNRTLKEIIEIVKGIINRNTSKYMPPP